MVPNLFSKGILPLYGKIIFFGFSGTFWRWGGHQIVRKEGSVDRTLMPSAPGYQWSGRCHDLNAHTSIKVSLKWSPRKTWVLRKVLSKIWHLSEKSKMVPDGWDCEKEAKRSEETMTGERKKRSRENPWGLGQVASTSSERHAKPIFERYHLELTGSSRQGRSS